MAGEMIDTNGYGASGFVTLPVQLNRIPLYDLAGLGGSRADLRRNSKQQHRCTKKDFTNH